MDNFTFDLQLFAKTTFRAQTKKNGSYNVQRVKYGSGRYEVANNTSARFIVEYDASGIKSLKNLSGAKATNGCFVQWRDYATGRVIRYYLIGDDGNMFKRVEGTFDENWKFIPNENTGVYAQTPKAGQLIKNSAFKAPTLKKINDTLDFSDGATSHIYYSLTKGQKSNAKAKTMVTVENIQNEKNVKSGANYGLKDAILFEKDGADYFKAKSDDIYLDVKTTTKNGISNLSVNALWVDACGNMKQPPDAGKRTVNSAWWLGSVTVSGKKSDEGSYTDRYAKLKYAKDKGKWHINITDAAIGSVATGLKAGDYIDTAATGEEGAELKSGTYTIYNKKKSGSKYVQEKRTLTVKGTVKVQIDENGKLAGKPELDAGEKVTWKDGRKTTTYAYNGEDVSITNSIVGTKYNDTVRCTENKDIFTLDVKKKSGKDKVYNFSVGDVIHMNNLSKKDISRLKGANLTSLMTKGFKFSSGGTLSVSTGATLKFDAKSKQITAK